MQNKILKQVILPSTIALTALTTLLCTTSSTLADSKSNGTAKSPGSMKSPGAIQSPSTKPKKGTKELLWKMTSESGATLYLLGTIHVFKESDYPLPEEMEKAFAKSRALIVEVDVTKTNKEEIQTFVQSKGAYTLPDNLTNHLSPKASVLLQAFCDRTKTVQYNKLIGMKPWLVAISILQIELDRLGYKSDSGVDLHFLREANVAAKKVIPLETLSFQLNLFAGLPADLQDKNLDLTLVDLADLPSDAGEMMKDWKTGDAKGMEEIMTKDIRENPELAPVQEKLLYERNVTMAQKLEAYLKGGNDTYLVAIGSGHLVGERSVIDLLTKKGYKVTQLAVGDDI